MGQFLSKKMDWDHAAEKLRKHITTPITSKSSNFEDQDVEMAGDRAKPENIEAYVAPQEGNPLKYYKIGVGFVGRIENSSVALGHAEIVIEEYDGLQDGSGPTEDSPLVIVNPLEVRPRDDEKDYRLPKAARSLIHIYKVENDTGGTEFTLAYEDNDSSLHFYRYVDMLRIYTTKRRIKHLALKACPAAHSMLVNDCATLASSFIGGLMDSLDSLKGLRDETSAAEFERRKEELLNHIHIEDKSAKTSEVEARRSARK